MTGPTAWQSAVAIEPQLAALEKFVGDLTRGDLPSVENWVVRFNRIFNSRPALADYRKPVFAHLLRAHNAAIERMEHAT